MTVFSSFFHLQICFKIVFCHLDQSLIRAMLNPTIPFNSDFQSFQIKTKNVENHKNISNVQAE